MNNSGQIIVLDQQGAVAGTPDSYFVYSSGNGQITRLPGGASSINDQGQVVVSASNPTTGGPVSAYLYNLATRSLQALVAPGSAPVEATAVNNAGQVAGFLYTSPSETAASAQPFLYSNGKMINIGAPDGLYGNALAINSQGDVVGLAKTATDASFHAFLYSNGVMKDLGTLPGGQGSWASSINNLGQIVGESWPGAGVGGAGGFLYSGGVMKDLNSLIDPNSPWWIYWAFQINNRGQILGIAESSMGEHYVLLTPEGLPRPGDAVYPTIVPEPSTWLLFAPLIGGLAIRHVRRRQVTQAG
jgi:probable HAF family extracellular repeat protein